MKKIAVLLACHNGALWLDEQVKSLLRQRNVSIDIFAADDDSSDETLQILRKFSFEYKNFHLLPFPNPAGSAARNFVRILCSIDLEEYDFISFSDQDDIWHDDKIDRAINALTSNNCDGYSASVQVLSDGKILNKLRQERQPQEFDFLLEGAGQGCSYVITNRLARSFVKIIGSAPLWREGPFYHDWCLYALSRILKYRWFFDRKPSLLYRQHQSNDIGAKTSVKGVLSRFARIRSGWYSERILHLTKFCILADEKNASVSSFVQSAFGSRDSFCGRFSFIYLLLTKSRRKFSDRFAVAVFEIFGLISVSFHSESERSTLLKTQKYYR